MEIFNRKQLKTYRRDLRSNMPKAELILWKYLRNKQLDGLKFRRQHSIGPYIVDFYCPQKRLVIELDGESHYGDKVIRQYDQVRDEYLKSQKIIVLRFLNPDIYCNLVGVLEIIRKAANPTQPPLSTGEVK